MIAASGMILSMMSRMDEVARVSSVVESELRNVRQKLQLKGQDFEKKTSSTEVFSYFEN